MNETTTFTPQAIVPNMRMVEVGGKRTAKGLGVSIACSGREMLGESGTGIPVQYVTIEVKVMNGTC